MVLTSLALRHTQLGCRALKVLKMLRSQTRRLREHHSQVPANVFHISRDEEFNGIVERQLIILGHVSQAPAMAKCTHCQLKFFVAKGLMKDPDAARAYLLSKFDHHICKFADIAHSESSSL